MPLRPFLALILSGATLVAACSPAEPEAVGGLYVATVATNAPDEDALYEVSVDGVSIGASISGLENPQDQVPLGEHTVFAHVPAGCRLEGANPVAATVYADTITYVTFHIDCSEQNLAPVLRLP